LHITGFYSNIATLPIARAIAATYLDIATIAVGITAAACP